MTNPYVYEPVQLYWEIRGAGPAVILIPGSPGDGGQFDQLALSLAQRRTVINYDRRGTSRSPAPAGWRSTSVSEHANDAAGVLTAAGVGPALAYGTSNGAAIALELAVSHPELVRGVILHEMPLISVIADPAPIGQLLGSIIERGMAAGGPPRALEDFLRFAFGDTVFDSWSALLRERILANAEMVFGIELPAFQAYTPDRATLEKVVVPAVVAVGENQAAPFFSEAATWLAAALGTTTRSWPGAHGPQFSCPDALENAILSVDPI